ncbi:unnamed protein product [Acanthosepion pharaonis]|uniref:Uncharacterized protein n=1 Tax=Acanthosepion pharaonis TaxID=158019 RepID=A0A812CM09_ACAPH|nr:unnamed protein product [Sepia pharaonis]
MFCSDYSGVAESSDSEDGKPCHVDKTQPYKHPSASAATKMTSTHNDGTTSKTQPKTSTSSGHGTRHTQKKPVTVHDNWLIMPYLSECFNCQQTYESFCQLALKLLRLPKAHMVLAICATIVIFLLVSAVALTYKVLLIQAKLETLQLWSPALKNLYRDKMHSDIYVKQSPGHSALVF